jgi:hypothetical protein
MTIGDIFYYTVFCVLFSFVISFVIFIFSISIIMILHFHKQIKYYKAIRKHPEIYGDANIMTEEIMSDIVQLMQDRTYAKFTEINPYIEQPKRKTADS